MTNIGIPLGSLKRDEIYTFLGGLTVSLAWLIRFGIINSYILQYNALTLGMIVTLMWLITTTITYICILLYMQVLYFSVKILLGDVDTNKAKKLINMENVGPLAIYYENIVEQHVNNHILNVVFVSLLFSLYPVLEILKNINIAPLLPFTVFISVALIAMFFSIRNVRSYIAFDHLIKEGLAYHISFQQHIIDMAEPFSETKKKAFENQINEALIDTLDQQTLE